MSDDGICSTLDGKYSTPREAPDVLDGMIGYALDVHDGICSKSAGKYSTPSEAPDLHYRICSTLLISNAVHPSD